MEFLGLGRRERYQPQVVSKEIAALTPRESERAICAIKAANLALDELGQVGRVPQMSFDQDLHVDGHSVSGAFFAGSPFKMGSASKIVVDIGIDCHRKSLGPELVFDLLEDGWPVDCLRKLAAAATAVEEIFHFTEEKKGILPIAEAIIHPWQGQVAYRVQPHEQRAQDFVAKLFDKLCEIASK